MLKLKSFATKLVAATMLSMVSITSITALAEEQDTDITEPIVSEYSITGTATHGAGNVWYVDISGNVFTSTWSEYWYYDGQAGVGEISYNDSSETDLIRVLHNSATHSGYVQNRSSLNGAWTKDAESGEWTNTASINHASGTIRWWLYKT